MRNRPRLADERIRDRIMEAVSILAEGDHGVRRVWPTEYFERFYDFIPHRGDGGKGVNNAISGEERALLLELSGIVDEACDATPNDMTAEELIATGWPERIQPVAEKALNLMRGKSPAEAIGATEVKDAEIYDAVPGGAELLRWFGQTPSFHDAEILDIHLRRSGRSILRLHGWINTGKVGPDRAYVLDRHAVVTFELAGVMDLQLDGFSAQNVIGGLTLRRAPGRPERHGYLALAPLPTDVEIELEPCYGLDGRIRARSVSITFEMGKPNDD